ncbi:MAG: DNA topoisomerase IB [Gemmatimonadota bacterium]
MTDRDESAEEKKVLGQDAGEAARQAGLRYVSDEDPGITRRGRGKGFSYYGPGETLIQDREERDRLNGLAIPPAWTDVWICPHADGHIQATGRDAEGRKQYRYHPDWRAIRDEGKYARMVAFGRGLPRIRRRTVSHLQTEGLSRKKVLAAVVRLLELSLIRVGNDEYARSNRSFGLTTLRDRHVELRGSRVRFEFRGKGGKRHCVDVDDPRLAAVVKQCRDVPGYELFQYYDEEEEKRAVDSTEVNDYLREISGDDFTAKDFRTWAGTMQMAAALLDCGPCDDERESKSRVNEAVRLVADQLGNTPAICRECYIHPEIIERYMDDTLAEELGSREGRIRFQKVRGLSVGESAVLALLERRYEAEPGASSPGGGVGFRFP